MSFKEMVGAVLCYSCSPALNSRPSPPHWLDKVYIAVGLSAMALRLGAASKIERGLITLLPARLQQVGMPVSGVTAKDNS